MTDQKNTILAIVLSAMVLIAWQYFVGMPQMEKQRQEAQLKAATAAAAASPAARHAGYTRPGRRTAQPGAPAPRPACHPCRARRPGRTGQSA